MRGKFITFEGGEGAGKSTQARRLADHLQGLGRSVTLTREPGGTRLAEEIRGLIFWVEPAHSDPLVATLLFNAARADHLASRIRPALDAGEWVVCDRFMDSTRAYQGAAGSVDAVVLDTLEDIVVGPTRPDLTILCDIDPELGLARVAERRTNETGLAQMTIPTDGDPFETRDLSFHRKLREGYLALAAAEPARFAVVDASLEPDVVARAIVAAVNERLLAEAR